MFFTVLNKYGHTKVKAFRIVLNDLKVGMHKTK